LKYKILIIDDDDLVCASLKKVLVKSGYDVDICLDGKEAVESIRNFQPDVILLDIYLKDTNGIDILKQINKMSLSSSVIMITGYSDVKIAVSAIKLGAHDFLLKPLDIDQLNFVMERSLQNLKLKSEVDKLNLLLQENEISRYFFGQSKKIQKVLDVAEKLAASPDTTILIEGESGTGKEGFAKFIHQQSPRKNKNFIKINCSAIPKELAESELFGYEKGAFTGAAQKTKLGKFELANEGTILLDEIGELSLDLQVKLLRVLQEKKFFRVGGEKEIDVNVRVLAASNKNIEEQVAKGNFREDLFYRLNVAKITIPPLRERKEDIPFLVYAFIKEFSAKFNKQTINLAPEILEILQSYNWKGNIRELRNAIERAVLLMDGEDLTEQHLSFLADGINHNQSEDEFLLKIPPKGVAIDLVLKTLIQKTLKITNGNQVKAAKVLGLSRSKLRYRMEQLGIEVTKNVQ
jgi:two-component system response regulator AtoC